MTLIFGSLASGTIYGYNAGVYTGVLLQMKDSLELTAGDLGNQFAVFFTFEIIGTLLAPMADRYGRKRMLRYSAAVLTLSPLLLVLDGSYSMTLLERAFSGLAGGITFTLGLVFVSEIAKKAQRSLLLSFLMIGVSLGYILEYQMSLTLITGEGWRMAIALASVPALMQLIGLSFMPESPSFLVLRGDTAAAKRAARWYGLEEEENNAPSQPDAVSLKQLFIDPSNRLALKLGLLVVLSGSMAGMSFMTFGPIILTQLGGLETQTSLALLEALAVIGCLISLTALIPIAKGYTAEVLVAGLLISSLSLLCLALVRGTPVVILFVVFQLAFCFGIRTTIFQILPRLLSDHARAKGMAAFNTLWSLLTIMNAEITPRSLEVTPSAAFIAYGIFALLLAVACWLFLRPHLRS
ncbi:MAG: MFS transporter [Pseudomonadota bacterium]